MKKSLILLSFLLAGITYGANPPNARLVILSSEVHEDFNYANYSQSHPTQTPIARHEVVLYDWKNLEGMSTRIDTLPLIYRSATYDTDDYVAFWDMTSGGTCTTYTHNQYPVAHQWDMQNISTNCTDNVFTNPPNATILEYCDFRDLPCSTPEITIHPFDTTFINCDTSDTNNWNLRHSRMALPMAAIWCEGGATNTLYKLPFTLTFTKHSQRPGAEYDAGSGSISLTTTSTNIKSSFLKGFTFYNPFGDVEYIYNYVKQEWKGGTWGNDHSIYSGVSGGDMKGRFTVNEKPLVWVNDVPVDSNGHCYVWVREGFQRWTPFKLRINDMGLPINVQITVAFDTNNIVAVNGVKVDEYGQVRTAIDNTTSLSNLDVKTNATVAGSISSGPVTSSGVVSSVDSTRTNGASYQVFHSSLGADATLGPMSMDLGSYVSASAGSRYAYISAYDASWIRPLALNPSGGGVGIGMTAPAYTLDVNGTGHFSGALTLGGTFNVATVSETIPSAANDANYVTFSTAIGTNATLGPLQFNVGSHPSATASSRYAYIDVADTDWVRPLSLNPSGGKVGIGTTSPQYNLDVTGSGRFSGDLLAGSGKLMIGGTTSSYPMLLGGTGPSIAFKKADDSGYASITANQGVFQGPAISDTFSFKTTGVTITSGNGAPSSNQPNGSLYLNTNGTSTTTLYIRVGGAWIAK